MCWRWSVIGCVALYRAARHIGDYGRRGAIVALVLGPIGAINGGLGLAIATGGPGSGNGGVGGAAALVLGLLGTGLGGGVVANSRRIPGGGGRVTWDPPTGQRIPQT